MSQRDYEEQPEAPDIASVLHEDAGETLVGTPGADPLDAGYSPPDRPYVVEDDEALSRDEDLDGRLSREVPDVTDPDAPNPGDPDRAPRLEAAEPTAATGYTEPTEATGAGLSGGAASAEEAAVHLRDEGEVGYEDDGYGEGNRPPEPPGGG